MPDEVKGQVKNLFDSFDSVFRYLLPGILFLIIFRLYLPKIFQQIYFDINGTGLLILSPFIGMFIYNLHKSLYCITFDLIAYLLGISGPALHKEPRKIKNYPVALAYFVAERDEHAAKKSSQFLYYKNAMAHNLLMFCEMIATFHFIRKNDSFLNNKQVWFIWIAIIIAIIGLLNLWIMYNLEKKYYGDAIKEKSGREGDGGREGGVEIVDLRKS